MEDTVAHSSPIDVPRAYPPLLSPDDQAAPAQSKRAWRPWLSVAVSALLLLSLLALLSDGSGRMAANFAADNGRGLALRRAPYPMSRGPAEGVSEKSTAWELHLAGENDGHPELDSPRHPRSRGPVEGVSEKSAAAGLGSGPSFNWTRPMLVWQRTAFHFQPQKNWMNDPDGPLYYKGWYHLFYQYNPDSAVWGNITWGHAVSRDLIHWLYLPLAMVPDQWYDANGVWTGSVTFLDDGRLAMLYTGSTADSVQVQNVAFPADPTDPLLVRWSKSDANPVLVPPPGIGSKDFRDPTTAWYVRSQAAWLLAIGSKNDTDGLHAGITLVYKTTDFINYELLPGVLHEVPGTGMWECVDFYPVATEGMEGLDTSEPAGPGVKHVLKASMDDDRHDYYAIGTYEQEKNIWKPDEPHKDVGIGLRYDWGKFYASKTFYDQAKRRRVLWSWVGETDSERADVKKGWASLQAIPRTILFDQKTGTNLIQWPVEEIEKLRMGAIEFTSVSVDAGAVVPLDVGRATQMDIMAEFTIEKSALASVVEADVGYNCSTSGGAAGRGALGPFGLLVLADEDRSEQTAVYFYVSRTTDGEFTTHFCHDEIRSSEADDIVKRIVGNLVPVVDGETLTIRMLVDHSIVESFAQGGRTCITSRVYPTKAIYGAARLFLFNNATDVGITAKSVKVWQMDSAFLRPYSGDDDDYSAAFPSTTANSIPLYAVVITLVLLLLPLIN